MTTVVLVLDCADGDDDSATRYSGFGERSAASFMNAVEMAVRKPSGFALSSTRCL